MADKLDESIRSEQYPLLKVEDISGAGDALQQPATTIPASAWTTAVRKAPWYDRVPEYFSICWISLIIFGIGFLLLYISTFVSFGNRSLQPLFISAYNESRHGAKVHYHHIVPRRSPIRIPLYSSYLSAMADRYPNLKFQLTFLIDDSLQTSHGLKHNWMFADEQSNNDLKTLLRKHKNIFITTMKLSVYMATTPLKCQWKTIPHSYLILYARIFDVLQYGGIGLDLDKYNNKYGNLKPIDRKLASLLQYHNDGYKLEDYREIFKIINENDYEESIVSILINSIMSQVMQDSQIFFDANLQNTLDYDVDAEKRLSRTHRTKREAISKPSSNFNITRNYNETQEEKSNNTADRLLNNLNVNINKTSSAVNQISTTNISSVANNSTILNKTDSYNFSSNFYTILNKTDDSLEPRKQFVYFYDFSLSSGDTTPMYLFPNPMPSGFGSKGPSKCPPCFLKYLIVAKDLSFLVASTAQHPFLEDLVSTNYIKADFDAVVREGWYKKCAGFQRAYYCNSISFV